MLKKFMRLEVNISMNCKIGIENLDCANCARKIEEELKKEKVLTDVSVNFSTSSITFKSSDQEKAIKRISEVVKKVEPDAQLILSSEKAKVKKDYDIYRLIIGFALYLISIVINDPLIKEILIILAYLILLYRVFLVSMKMLIRQKTINENFLIFISALGAYFIDKKMEGIMVITLYEIGKLLEKRAINNTRKSIKGLMDLQVEVAHKVIGDKIVDISPSKLEIDDTIMVKKGEKVPNDGILLSPDARFYTAAITGESNVQHLKKDERILSGFINEGEVALIKVDCKYENSTAKRVLDLVENATNRKAKTETYVNRLAKIYTPAVFVLAILVFLLMPLITGSTYQESFYQALVLLVISCPCSIAISVPLSYFTGIGKASKEGILIKGSDYLDGFKDIKQIVFDKTGTITTGKFQIGSIKTYDNYTTSEVLNLLYKGESFSNHPIAKAILKNKKDIDTSDVKNFKEHAGLGLSFEVGKDKIKVGNAKFCNVNDYKENVLYMTINGGLKAEISLIDEIKQGSKEAIAELKKRGIKVKMFTGDKKEMADAIAKEVGIAIEDTEAAMLPEDKYQQLDELIKESKTSNTLGKVAFAGDGINDAPVLALADIGISMGEVGQASAMEASDVIIMQDNLKKIVTTYDISLKTRRIIKQNLIFAIGTKVIILILNLLGISNMWEAVFADVGTTLLTILNTTRILRSKGDRK